MKPLALLAEQHAATIALLPFPRCLPWGEMAVVLWQRAAAYVLETGRAIDYYSLLNETTLAVDCVRRIALHATAVARWYIITHGDAALVREVVNDTCGK
jgi:hypothetical protein